jgi:hypothetical protein
MKHRNSLLLDLWMIIIGIILWISGGMIDGMGIIRHVVGFFRPVIWYEYTWAFYLGLGMIWTGLLTFILGAFRIITSLIREYFDRRKTLPEPRA